MKNLAKSMRLRKKHEVIDWGAMYIASAFVNKQSVNDRYMLTEMMCHFFMNLYPSTFNSQDFRDSITRFIGDMRHVKNDKA